MAGIDVGGKRGGRRPLDADIQPIPMIDLMMVTIAFLLITAVWTNMERLNANANAPNDPTKPVIEVPKQKSLHVELTDERFVLSWRQGSEIVDRFEVPRHRVEEQQGPVRMVRFPELSAKLSETWAAAGSHRDPGDRAQDRAVLHAPDTLPYSDLIALMDAIQSVKRPTSIGPQRVEPLHAFDVTLATN
jgi:biopolymer transport protein ExbD